MDRYAQISGQIHEILARYTPLIEPLSLDEAFLDVGGSEALFGSPVAIARRIKDEIRNELHLAASVGVAPNKFLAKIASDLEKPDALVVVDPTRVQQFLDPLPVSRLWGVGRVTQESFTKLGIQTIRDVRECPVEMLRERFGKSGEHLWNLANGHDSRRVIPDREAKSISHETTFAADIDDPEILRSWLLELTEQVGRRLRRHELKGRTVQIKVRFDDFSTITRAQTLAAPTNITHTIWQSAAALLSERMPANRKPVRLLGVGVTGFETTPLVQQQLFTDPAQSRRTDLDAAADQIKSRFGAASLQPGARLLRNEP
jgi:DNA polymerase-4